MCKKHENWKSARRRTWLFLFMGILILTFSFYPLVNAAAGGSDTCKYCGSSSYGSGCPYSPVRKHEHIGDDRKCIFCGSSSYGNGCPYSETRKHLHGHGSDKCIYCGSKSFGHGCPYSPARIHER